MEVGEAVDAFAPSARRIASAACRRYLIDDIDEAHGDALEALVRLTLRYPELDAVGLGRRVSHVLAWRVLEAFRERSPMWRKTTGGRVDRHYAVLLPLSEVDDARPSDQDVAVQATDSAFVEAILASLPVSDRRIVLAAAEPGGLTRLALSEGVTQGAMTHRLDRIRKQVRRSHLERSSA